MQLDELETIELEEWRIGRKTARQVACDIGIYDDCRKRDQKRLDNAREYLSKHIPGYDEWMEFRAKKLEQEVAYWERYIAFLKWLQEQPTYKQMASAHTLARNSAAQETKKL